MAEASFDLAFVTRILLKTKLDEKSGIMKGQ